MVLIRKAENGTVCEKDRNSRRDDGDDRSELMVQTDLQKLSEAPSGVLIENVEPLVDCGRYALKREEGDRVDVTADIFREGHDLIAAVI